MKKRNSKLTLHPEQQSTHTPNQSESIIMDLNEKINESQAENQDEPPDR